MVRDNNPRQQVEEILAAQPSRELRVKDADDIILNDDEIDRLEPEVEKLHTLYIAEAKGNAS